MPKLPRFKPKELVKLALKSGFVLNRTQGSHFIYFRRHDEKSISIPIHGNENLGIGISHALIEQMDLTLSQALKILKRK